MIAFCRNSLGIRTVFVTFILGCGNACLSENQGAADMLNNEVTQLEALWETGNAQAYYAGAVRIAGKILSHTVSSDGHEAALRLLNSLLEKASKSPIAGEDDLFAMEKVASYLLSSPPASAEDRQANAQLLSRYLGEIRKERVKDYKPAAVRMDISPPPGVPGMAGMSPKAIRDPDARRKYEDDIQKNKDINRTNSRQATLRDADKRMSAFITEYMAKTFQPSNSPASLMDECVKNARLTDEEHTKLKQRIEDARKKATK